MYEVDNCIATIPLCMATLLPHLLAGHLPLDSIAASNLPEISGPFLKFTQDHLRCAKDRRETLVLISFDPTMRYYDILTAAETDTYAT